MFVAVLTAAKPHLECGLDECITLLEVGQSARLLVTPQAKRNDVCAAAGFSTCNSL